MRSICPTRADLVKDDDEPDWAGGLVEVAMAGLRYRREVATEVSRRDGLPAQDQIMTSS